MDPSAQREGEGEGGPAGSASLSASARTIGRIAWFDRRLFEVLSGWAAWADDPRVAVALAEQARQRAWHADLWFARLPELREVDAEAQVAPAGTGIEAFCDALAAIGAEGGDVEDPALAPTVVALAALARVVVPHQVALTVGVAERCRPAADRALARTAELVRRDQVEHWQEAARSLDERLGRLGGGADDPSPVLDALASRQAALEALLVGAGGITGSAT